MRKTEAGLSFDSRDLMRSQCLHCTKLSLARESAVPGLQELLDNFYVKPDNLAIRYGMRFEGALEKELLAALGDLVQAPSRKDQESTIELMRLGVPVIYQGALRGGSGEITFSGRPDFLLRGDYRFAFGDSGLTAIQVGSWAGGYTAWDAKLSATAKTDYQVQVGLYVDVLREIGFEAVSEHGLILGNRELMGFNADFLIAQMVEKRDEFINTCSELIQQFPISLEGLGPLICEASSYCEMCEYPKLCRHFREETNHLQLVANITRANIESLNRSGVNTVRELSKFAIATDKLSLEQVEKLARQARLQQSAYDTKKVHYEVISNQVLESLPEPNPGDLFFDLEGFTFFAEPGGLEYLWGYVDGEGEFFYHWADDRDAEQLAFEAFMREALRRQNECPGCKIYHYAAYEQTALKKLAARTGRYESEVGYLLGTGALVDLFKIVQKGIMISEERYSIKNLENFYRFDRSSNVKEAMGSMEYYDEYLSALTQDNVEAERLKRQVIAYNHDDCSSTLALYRWLKSLA